jgi:hypothetical protein
MHDRVLTKLADGEGGNEMPHCESDVKENEEI